MPIASSLEPLAGPAPLPLHSSRAWGIFSLISKDSSSLGRPCSADISLLEFCVLQHPPKVTALAVGGASAARAGRMQDLLSRPLCVTFARPGLFLGPTISYRQDSCRGPIKVVASAVYLRSFDQGGSYPIMAFLGNKQRDLYHLRRGWKLPRTGAQTALAPPELTQQHSSTNS